MPRPLLLLAVVGGCTGADDGGLAAGTRLVTGRVRVSADGPTQRPALQVVGVYAAASCGVDAIRVGAAGTASACAIFGAPFDPGAQGGGVDPAPFQLVVPCDVTVNLVVQTVGGAGGGRVPGDLLALLAFPSGVDDAVTTLLAREPACRDTALLATNVLDLGELTVPATAPATGPATVVIGGPGGGTNPLDTVDTDGDQLPNAADPDDDNDLTDDAMDDDADGDGAADAAQAFVPAWFSPTAG